VTRTIALRRFSHPVSPLLLPEAEKLNAGPPLLYFTRTLSPLGSFFRCPLLPPCLFHHPANRSQILMTPHLPHRVPPPFPMGAQETSPFQVGQVFRLKHSFFLLTMWTPIPSVTSRLRIPPHSLGRNPVSHFFFVGLFKFSTGNDPPPLCKAHLLIYTNKPEWQGCSLPLMKAFLWEKDLQEDMTSQVRNSSPFFPLPLLSFLYFFSIRLIGPFFVLGCF